MAEPAIPLRPPDAPSPPSAEPPSEAGAARERSWRERARALGAPTAGLAKRTWQILGGLDSAFSFLRTFAVNGALFVALLFTAALAVKEVRRDVLLIEPIHVPPELTKLGHTPEGTARGLMEAILEVREKSTTLKTLQELTPEWEKVDIELPEAGFSIQPILDRVRDFLGHGERTIAGEIIGNASRGYTMRLWTTDREPLEVRVPDEAKRADYDALLAAAARDYLRVNNPYVLALYEYAKEHAAGHTKRNKTITELITLALDNNRTDDDAWAYNLWGLDLQRQKKNAAAIRKYEQARQRSASDDKVFALATFNIAQAYASQIVVPAKDASTQDAYQKAIEWYRKAIEADRDEPAFLLRWGYTEFQAAQYGEAERQYRKAIAIDPKNGAAYYNIGLLRDREGRFADAVEAYRKAIEYGERDAETEVTLVCALYALKEQTRIVAEQTAYNDWFVSVSEHVTGATDAAATALAAFKAGRDEARDRYRDRKLDDLKVSTIVLRPKKYCNNAPPAG